MTLSVVPAAMVTGPVMASRSDVPLELASTAKVEPARKLPVPVLDSVAMPGPGAMKVPVIGSGGS